jgi:hypothetical protein
MKKETLKLVLLSIFFITVQKGNAQTFGRYGDCSTGRGICGIGTTNFEERLTTQKFILAPQTDTSIQLVISLKNISLADEIKIFGKVLSQISIKAIPLFVMEADLPIAESYKSILKLPLIISKITMGSYASMIIEDKIIINLKVK